MTTLIRQRAAYDCSICAIAMATGRAYGDVLLAAGDCYRPEKGTRREYQILERLGLAQGGHDGEPLGDFFTLDRGVLAADYFRLFARGRRALIALPSLNTAGDHHMIYFDGIRIFDPSPKRTYVTFAELLPDGLILFQETRP